MTVERTLDIITLNITIAAAPAVVWNALTDPSSMAEWMAEPGMELRVETGWSVGSPIIMHAVHHLPFTNTGTVLEFLPNERLRYSHRSSLSRLPDLPQHQTILDFHLRAVPDGTMLSLNISIFPTETIREHLEMYWRGTVVHLRTYCEHR